MADVSASVVPCDGEGFCMACKTKPVAEETLTCKTCVTPWHVPCLPVRPETLAQTLMWDCPDCSLAPDDVQIGGNSVVACGSGGSGGLIAAIKAIELDESLTEKEKAKRRQELMSGGASSSSNGGGANPEAEETVGGSNVLKIVDETLTCSICMQLMERPVTSTCGHNFCIKCVQKWVKQGKGTCPKCRRTIPPSMARNPRINSMIVNSIRNAKQQEGSVAAMKQRRPVFYLTEENENRPDKAFTTERAKKAGLANASCGRMFVEVANDHFGPITAENDPEMHKGVVVGDTWANRIDCKQSGVHLTMVGGIHGQSKVGAQSVALSGGYVDDEDHGEWFLYTGSGGRDLSGNKRTNKNQSFDQKFTRSNQALRASCLNGYPVRVVRSCKEKRSSYAPEWGVRYDGIYRIDKCWRKVGKQGFKVCRYLFVRCDNMPAPWASDDQGDRPRPLPAIRELQDAIDITEREGAPSWDYDEEKTCWMWKKAAPRVSKRRVNSGRPKKGTKITEVIQQKEDESAEDMLLKGLQCKLCINVMTCPVTTPCCAHNFCKHCILGAFDGIKLLEPRTCGGGRTLRSKRNVKKCPECQTDIAVYLENPLVNTEIEKFIKTLKSESKDRKLKEAAAQRSSEGSSEITDGSNEKSDLVDEDMADANGEFGIGEEEFGPVEPEKSTKKKQEATAVEGKLKRATKRKKSSKNGGGDVSEVGVKRKRGKVQAAE